MDVLELKGQITSKGRLEVELPAGTPPGEVWVRIELTSPAPPTEEEITALMQTQPATGAEIVSEGLTGVWHDVAAEDGQAWVARQRRARKARRT